MSMNAAVVAFVLPAWQSSIIVMVTPIAGGLSVSTV